MSIVLKDRQQIVQGHSSFFTVSCGNRTSWFFWMHLRQKGIFSRQSRCSPQTTWGEICRMRLFVHLMYLLMLCVSPTGKFYCKPHYCYRLSGYAQRKRPAPSAAPVTAKVHFYLLEEILVEIRIGLEKCSESALISPRATDVKNICVICRRIRPPKYLLRPWMPLEGRWQQLPPRLTSNPQVLDFPI